MSETDFPLFGDQDSYEFKRELLAFYIDKVIGTFQSHFENRGYIRHPAASLISAVDNSVLFIGATISVFKPYILNKSIPSGGYYLVQRCLRTRNVAVAYDDNVFPEWTSSFIGIGTISGPDRLKDVCSDAWEFLNTKLGIERTRISIRISSQDHDLMKYWTNLKNGPVVEIDTKQPEYYRHKFGLEGVRGRNFNFALKQRDEQFKDIGNVILIERNPSEPLAAELAFGVGTLLSRVFQLDHPIQTSLINQVYPFATGLQTKLADALVVCVILLREGLKPIATNRGRILRRHLQSLSYLKNEASFDKDELVKIAREYELAEYGNSTDIADRIGNYLAEFERLTILGFQLPEINKKLSQMI